jgi:hypothetical protein
VLPMPLHFSDILKCVIRSIRGTLKQRNAKVDHKEDHTEIVGLFVYLLGLAFPVVFEGSRAAFESDFGQ